MQPKKIQISASELQQKLSRVELERLEKRFEFKGKKRRRHECFTNEHGVRVCE